MTTVPSFTCPRCGAMSFHPRDAEHGYCGNCHRFTRDPDPAIVGICGACLGPVVQPTIIADAACQCGKTTIARGFFALSRFTRG